MKYLNFYTTFLSGLFFTSCVPAQEDFKADFTIAFGSCNNQFMENHLWTAIKENNPNVFIWGGDVIYSDTFEQKVLEENYHKQLQNKAYENFSGSVEILGTWDDHDYGDNDAGAEYPLKDVSQKLFLDFLKTGKDDPIRLQKGIYDSKIYKVNGHEIKIILLDTRYFRTSLTRATGKKKRYTPNVYGEGTILGETQWSWLKDELEKSKANFNIIMSSIQVLSSEHGFETWGNMPHEVDKLMQLISDSKAKNVILLSGDRHIAEISSKKNGALSYPIIDFTSSGMTHSYSAHKGEPNQYRISKVVADKNFGLLKFDFSENQVLMEIKWRK
ncbi:MAG: alkaline phosphatase D family protein [Flavobacteriaceae bacterium]|nr:alkaline phosphatase D family protein [Flavobacteriaceae bacterium]